MICNVLGASHLAAQCSMVCAVPNCGASRRNLAFAWNAALRAVLLRFAQPKLLRSMHASTEFAVNRRKLGDFVVVTK